MVGSGGFERYEAVTFNIPGPAERFIHLLLERLIERIEPLGAMVEIEPVRLRVMQTLCHLADQFLPADGPMCGEAGCATKQIWVFADGIERDQSTHARTHDERMCPVGTRTIGDVDERLQLLDDEPKVRVRNRLTTCRQEKGLMMPRETRRSIWLLRHIFAPADLAIPFRQ